MGFYVEFDEFCKDLVVNLLEIFLGKIEIYFEWLVVMFEVWMFGIFCKKLVGDKFIVLLEYVVIWEGFEEVKVFKKYLFQVIGYYFKG